MVRQLAIWTVCLATCVTTEQLLSSCWVLHAANNAVAKAILVLAALKPCVVDLFLLPVSLDLFSTLITNLLSTARHRALQSLSLAFDSILGEVFAETVCHKLVPTLRKDKTLIPDSFLTQWALVRAKSNSKRRRVEKSTFRNDGL